MVQWTKVRPSAVSLGDPKSIQGEEEGTESFGETEPRLRKWFHETGLEVSVWGIVLTND